LARSIQKTDPKNIPTSYILWRSHDFLQRSEKSHISLVSKKTLGHTSYTLVSLGNPVKVLEAGNDSRSWGGLMFHSETGLHESPETSVSDSPFGSLTPQLGTAYTPQPPTQHSLADSQV